MKIISYFGVLKSTDKPKKQDLILSALNNAIKYADSDMPDKTIDSLVSTLDAMKYIDNLNNLILKTLKHLYCISFDDELFASNVERFERLIYKRILVGRKGITYQGNGIIDYSKNYAITNGIDVDLIERLFHEIIMKNLDMQKEYRKAERLFRNNKNL